MEIFTNLLSSFQFNLLQVFIICAACFVAAYWLALRKVTPLNKQINELEKVILELNEELLFGGNETPVIKFEHSPKTITGIAK
jgi:Na+/H+-dicarboxylate symporter